MKTFIESLNEQKPLTKSAAIVQGRFQGFHLGHKKVIDAALKRYGRVAVVIVEGAGSSKDKSKNPFTFNERKKFIRRVYPQANKVQILKSLTGYLGDEKTQGIVHIVRSSGFEPVALYSGADRVPSYEKMVERVRDALNLVDNFKVEEIPRTAAAASATKVRNALREDDRKTFETLVPKELHGFYETMKRKFE
jgi:citrate lyase synthetase